jgi:uncharacterized protein
LSVRTKSNEAASERLCPACGLCCNGVIFANLVLQPGDRAARLRSLGLPVRNSQSALRPPHLAQPCAAFDGCRCRVYADRPKYCRQFECALLKSVKAGQTEPAAALRIIRTARARADKVLRLIRTLGDADEQLPLSTRFRRTSKRLKEHELDKETADTYGQLTLAFHDLNLLLGDSFYPGSTRRGSKFGALGAGSALICAALVSFAAASPLSADQVELQNGDRYVGHVLSLNSNSLVLQSEVLGTLRLPRSKVAIITLGPSSTTNFLSFPLATKAPTPPPSAAPANAASNLSPVLPGLSANTNLIQQVQKQFLSGAGPEANTKFNELLGGLMSGKLSVDDIRAEAKSAADQLRTLQRESGEDAGFASSAYLSILDRFLKETAPSGAATNVPASPAASKPPPAEKDE